MTFLTVVLHKCNHIMASLSLVAYEDSESDEESTTSNESVSSTLKCDSTIKQFLGRPGCSATGFPLASQRTNTTTVGPLWHFNSSPWQQPQSVESCKMALQMPHPLPQSPACPNPVKRLASSPVGVRPYIPKRQRLAPTNDEVTMPGPSVSGATEKGTATTTTTSRVSGAHMFTEVSERVRPFLGQKVGRMELPRRVLLEVQAHQGPVNTVQWCPVPQTSHLLLSASMDRTVKVRGFFADTDSHV